MARARRTTREERARLRVRISIAAGLIAALGSCRGDNDAKSGGQKTTTPSKLYRVLRDVASQRNGIKHRVIVRTRHDRLGAVEDRIEKRGNHVESQHPRLDSFT